MDIPVGRGGSVPERFMQRKSGLEPAERLLNVRTPKPLPASAVPKVDGFGWSIAAAA